VLIALSRPVFWGKGVQINVGPELGGQVAAFRHKFNTRFTARMAFLFLEPTVSLAMKGMPFLRKVFIR
jgi:hypothetical protein